MTGLYLVCYTDFSSIYKSEVRHMYHHFLLCTPILLLEDDL